MKAISYKEKSLGKFPNRQKPKRAQFQSPVLPIVIVDDSREDALLAVRILKQCKVVNPVVVLSGGEECLNFFEGKGEHRHRSLPCLLFLDLAMNPVSGVDVLRHLKNHLDGDSKLGGSIAIMLSGVQDLKLVNEGYQLGASTFLIKPLQCEDVMQIASTVRGLGVVRNEEGNLITLDPHPMKKPSAHEDLSFRMEGTKR